ncbi:hypothetical protein PFISCL1PPCAC_3345 [Pristionchus fissidentatus]|uniref:Uncharacterized protein n=1 Tax=Pristionchus fissidentatus TaxID=1538716 RepID=A0AAV5UZ41_9BILA|nr:hypothetical protein PFISCL1PPCAC_3345 [Pristionchus fissidentatus]
MVLMTIDILILLVELPLAPDDVALKSHGGEIVCDTERAQREEATGIGGERKSVQCGRRAKN